MLLIGSRFFLIEHGTSLLKEIKTFCFINIKKATPVIKVCSIELKIKFKLRDKMWPVELQMETNQLYLPK